MKATKITLILLTIFMYIWLIPLLYFFLPNETIARFVDPETLTPVIQGIMIAGIVGISSLAILNAIFSVISIFKGEYNPTKLVMVLKIVLIPYFIFNFVYCILLVAACLNPFMMLAIPLVIAISIFFTYVCMLSTSLPSIAYAIRSLIKRRVKVSPFIIIGMALSLFFCVDAAGAIMIYYSTKNNEIQNS